MEKSFSFTHRTVNACRRTFSVDAAAAGVVDRRLGAAPWKIGVCARSGGVRGGEENFHSGAMGGDVPAR